MCRLHPGGWGGRESPLPLERDSVLLLSPAGHDQTAKPRGSPSATAAHAKSPPSAAPRFPQGYRPIAVGRSSGRGARMGSFIYFFVPFILFLFIYLFIYFNLLFFFPRKALSTHSPCITIML